MRRWALLAAAAALLTVAAPADEDDLLQRALGAEAAVPHRGVQVVEVLCSEPPLASEVAVAGDGAGHTHRIHRSGPRRGLEVVDDGRWEWHKQPGSDLWVPTVALLRPSPREDMAQIRANYQLTRGDDRTVAGRTTVCWQLRPRHAGNARRDLWLDRYTGLPLRIDLYNRDGRLVGRTTYTSVSFKRPADHEVALPADARRAEGVAPGCLTRVDSAAELERTLGRRPLRPQSPPAGYRLRATYLKSCRRGGWSPLSVYFDGLNSFTVMEPAGGNRRGWRWGWRRRCQTQTNALQVVVRTRVGGQEVVLVGDLPAATLTAVAESLAR